MKRITKERINMKNVYLVGGAVRDIFMGVKPKDKDYVVTGSSAEEMVSAGFVQVGANFPVFLHPTTGEEYALARREKKTGVGYLGFTSEFGTDVTLEEDLQRRDLTINSIAIKQVEDENSPQRRIYDPFNGREDIKNKILRHTSDAFAEDPVRVLRLARFRARFGSKWTVAPETAKLVYQMAKKGVLNELTAERVWKEMSRALMEPWPRLFFDTLLELDALHVIFPEVYKLKTALEARMWHPEGDAFEHTMLVLTVAADHEYDLETRLACLVHDFGKGATARHLLPKHHGHDVNGVPIVEAFCNRLTVPAKMTERVMKTTLHHMRGHDLEKMTSKAFVKLYDALGAKNDKDIITVLYRVFVCDQLGRLGHENDPIDNLEVFLHNWNKYQSVTFSSVFPNGETNVEKIKHGLYRARIAAVAKGDYYA